MENLSPEPTQKHISDSETQPKEDVQNSVFVAVKIQRSQDRGELWRVCVFINGRRFIRPGFQKKKAAIKLAAMLVQQMLINGWRVRWKVTDENGVDVRLNLAALGSKMYRGERKDARSE